MLAKESLYGALYKSGALSLFRGAAARIDGLSKRAGLPLPQRGVLIYMLHQITEPSTPFRRGIELDLFDAFCAHLAQHYQVLPLEELERQRRSGRVPSRAVALTFDDGHADNYHLALPVLRRYNLPATVFVCTGFINHALIPWSTRLALILEHAKRPTGPVEVDGIALELATVDERLRMQDKLWGHFQLMKKARTNALLDQLAERLDVDVVALARKQVLTWEQIAEMDALGFRAGAHTVMHPFLTRIPLDQARREMQQSKEELEGRLGRKIETFAYPNGKEQDYSTDLMAAAREVGFSLAVTALHGANDGRRDPFDLRRVSLYGGLEDAATRLERFFYATG